MNKKKANPGNKPENLGLYQLGKLRVQPGDWRASGEHTLDPLWGYVNLYC